MHRIYHILSRQDVHELLEIADPKQTLAQKRANSKNSSLKTKNSVSLVDQPSTSAQILNSSLVVRQSLVVRTLGEICIKLGSNDA